MQAMAFDICIRGSGVVGMGAALLLARERVRVGLVQSPARAAPDIRAFALNAASKNLLQSLRAWPAAAACPVQHMQVHGDDGGEVVFDAAEEGLAWIVDAAALEASLQQALHYAPSVELLKEPQQAGLTLICEGQSSASRAALGIAQERSGYGQQAIAAQIQCELPHGHTARQWFAGGEVLALLPRQTESGNSVALVWSVHDDHAKELLAMTDAAFCAALHTACAGALGAMALHSVRAAWPLAMASAQRWVGQGSADTAGTGIAGSWALAGDAAHTVHPLAGQGLNLGLADVACLVGILSSKEYFRSYGDLRLLRRYERARVADAAALRQATDGLQRLFAHTDARVQSLRNWGMNSFNQLNPLKNWVMQRAMAVPIAS
jgi:2-polyprenyl-6-methoxyphenol hydroxylase-like FAD-dependent oxidoreductase